MGNGTNTTPVPFVNLRFLSSVDIGHLAETNYPTSRSSSRVDTRGRDYIGNIMNHPLSPAAGGIVQQLSCVGICRAKNSVVVSGDIHSRLRNPNEYIESDVDRRQRTSDVPVVFSTRRERVTRGADGAFIISAVDGSSMVCIQYWCA